MRFLADQAPFRRPRLGFAVLLCLISSAPRLLADSKDGQTEVEMKVVRGSVSDKAGLPVGGARLWLPLMFQPKRVVEGKSDASGRFELRFPASWVSPRVVGSGWTVWAYAAGHGVGTQSAYDVVRRGGEKQIEVRLTNLSNTRFKVLTPAGEPLAGAIVEPKAYKAAAAFDLVPDEMLSFVSARTDAKGMAALPAVQANLLFRVRVVSEEFGNQAIRVDRHTDEPVREIRLRETGRIEGRLVGAPRVADARAIDLYDPESKQSRFGVDGNRRRSPGSDGRRREL